MKWLDDVVASVPEDFKPEARGLPPGAVTISALTDDLVPVVRAWMYTQTAIFEAKRAGLRKSAKVFAEMVNDQLSDREAITEEVKGIVSTVERLESRAEALKALLAVALREQFTEFDDENLGAGWTPDDGWTVFRAPDDRRTLSLAALLGLPPL